ncbi:hypothetical protein CXG81DRAFT_25050 [Caulochytrium protostelioides]|uniref:Uncharacterized protein n=1 Tax=Caulochytrium protostelioides TaxID=1555241 RepID=A0A4P9XAZ1_9FUNG|nr:hypothetical protein CXG81DRAFT_25050 [Caulochytrium protostelioides]|eukprot:RKP02271.1 hypothetical protein CXG81DRAFT_25050 [Caulochytrium protostelioides]
MAASVDGDTTDRAQHPQRLAHVLGRILVGHGVILASASLYDAAPFHVEIQPRAGRPVSFSRALLVAKTTAGRDAPRLTVALTSCDDWDTHYAPYAEYALQGRDPAQWTPQHFYTTGGGGLHPEADRGRIDRLALAWLASVARRGYHDPHEARLVRHDAGTAIRPRL